MSKYLHCFDCAVPCLLLIFVVSLLVKRQKFKSTLRTWSFCLWRSPTFVSEFLVFFFWIFYLNNFNVSFFIKSGSYLIVFLLRAGLGIFSELCRLSIWLLIVILISMQHWLFLVNFSCVLQTIIIWFTRDHIYQFIT